MFMRENNKLRSKQDGLAPRQRGRKVAVTLADYIYECKRLRMENELLRNFLHLAGRMRGRLLSILL